MLSAMERRAKVVTLPAELVVGETEAPSQNASGTEVIQLRLSAMKLHQPRLWGACWLACLLYEELDLNRFFAGRLKPSRKDPMGSRSFYVLVSQHLEPGTRNGETSRVRHCL